MSGDLQWGVRPSFLRYVRVLAVGTTRLADGASEIDDGMFAWPLRDVVRGEGELLLQFSGSVRFGAHAGYLDVDLRDPRLRLADGGGDLGVAPEGEAHITIAKIDAQAAGALVPRLTPDGVEMFGNVYAEGTEFSPLSVQLPKHL